MTLAILARWRDDASTADRPSHCTFLDRVSWKAEDPYTGDGRRITVIAGPFVADHRFVLRRVP